MKDFPSCFGENGVQVADFSSSSTNRAAAQNLVTCVYQCRLRGRSCLISVTWNKNLMSQSLSVAIDDNNTQSLFKMDIKPWLFSKKKGSKSIELDSIEIEFYWDFLSAKFGSGPEPLAGFYLGFVFNKQMILLLGDMKKEAYKNTNASPFPSNPIFVAKRENIFGKKSFSTKAQFSEDGPVHDLVIECDPITAVDPGLMIRVDSKTVMQVKHLRWKFRGNHMIIADGSAVEVFWDVHGWLFGNSTANAVFMFNTSLSAEKIWAAQSLSDPDSSSWSWSQRFQDSQSKCLGFSLILYAWKNE